MSTIITVVPNEARICSSAGYNYIFSIKSGMFVRWGMNKDDDPIWAPHGPEILDIEISQNGCPNNCPYCYKNNSGEAPTNMSLATFKKIMDGAPKTVCQIAFGITGLQTNPDLIPILEHCRSLDIVPNLTMTGTDLTSKMADVLGNLLGGCAVSLSEPLFDHQMNYVLPMITRKLKQVNAHLMVSKETAPFIERVFNTVHNTAVPLYGTDHGIDAINAFILLGLKKRGRGEGFTTLPLEDYKKLIELAIRYKIQFGVDSCSVSKLQSTGVELPPALMEPCESGLFSGYINVHGEFLPCSFMEGIVAPIDVVNRHLAEVWRSRELDTWRLKLIANKRSCPHFEV